MIDSATKQVKDEVATLIGTSGKIQYSEHKDPDVDIAVLRLSGAMIMQKNLLFSSFDIDEDAFDSNKLRESGSDEGSLVYMLGYPLGLVNVSSNQPICRLGCIARMNEAQIQENRNIIVDIQNFPGNSGSPIINRPDVTNITGTKHLEKSVLIGIVHSYIPYKDLLQSAQTKEIVEIRNENSGLAWVHPVEYIRQVIDEIQPQVVIM
jgi:hypothetical protein